MNDDTSPPAVAMKLFQITEDDLQTLERIAPALCERMYGHMDTQTRVRFDKIKAILSNVRWNYGPPLKVITIPADDSQPEEPRQ